MCKQARKTYTLCECVTYSHVPCKKFLDAPNVEVDGEVRVKVDGEVQGAGMKNSPKWEFASDDTASDKEPEPDDDNAAVVVDDGVQETKMRDCPNWEPASEKTAVVIEGTCGMLPGGRCPYAEEKKKLAAAKEVTQGGSNSNQRLFGSSLSMLDRFRWERSV
jgi:hypothetical protein